MTNIINIPGTPLPVGTVSVNMTLNASYVATTKSSVVVAIRYKFDGTNWVASDSEIKLDSNGSGVLLA